MPFNKDFISCLRRKVRPWLSICCWSMAWYTVSEETLKVIQLFFPEWSANLFKGTLAWGKRKRQRWKSFLVCIFEFSIICSNCQCQKFSLKCFYHKKTGTWNILSANDHSIRNYTESTSLCFIKSRVIFLQFSGDLVENTSRLLTCIAA